MWKSITFPGGLILLIASVAAASGVTGKWAVVAKSSNGETYYLTMVLTETDGKLTGTLGNEEGEVPLERLELVGEEIRFELTTSEGVTYSVKMNVSESQMSGGFSGSDGSSGSVDARRPEGG